MESDKLSVSVDQPTPHRPDAPSPSSASAHAASASSEGWVQVMAELVRDMREQRVELVKEHERAAAERRSERRWRMLFQLLLFGTPLILGLLYFLFVLSSAGLRLGPWPWSQVVGVVRIEGKIESNALACAEKVIPALEKAFSSAEVKAVVLSIDSPGGAPVEAERISSAIASFRQKHPKPVVAVINNLGASAAYMIAMHADKVVAGNYSLVGSIGAIMAPWDVSKALGRLDVSQRVYASGKLKAFLNPFTAPSPEAEAKARQIVSHMGNTFVEELHRARGHALKAGVDYGTGEVWGGAEAKRIGLVDEIGTLDEVVATTWGLKTYDYGPREKGFGGLLSGFQESLSSLLSRALTDQALAIR